MELINTYTSSSAAAQSSKPSSTPSAPAINVSAQTDLATFGSKGSGSSQGFKLQKALANLDIPEIANNDARVELNFNQDTGRVVAKIMDRASGEVLRELPSKELQQLFSHMREYLGSVVDEEI
ncbi:flagellar protein FlaG [Thalassospira lucentensis]|uniref:flagellar protein FlaG n=1 Tax=Thalassospira lucentensis TaxID=168935 RepID=UPI003D2EC675